MADKELEEAVIGDFVPVESIQVSFYKHNHLIINQSTLNIVIIWYYGFVWKCFFSTALNMYLVLFSPKLLPYYDSMLYYYISYLEIGQHNQ